MLVQLTADPRATLVLAESAPAQVQIGLLPLMQMTLVMAGQPGAAGESFHIDELGLLSELPEVTGLPEGYAFLATDTSELYFIHSGAWADPVPFGKGDKGDPGNDGYTPVKGVDYFDGDKGDQGDQGEPGMGIPVGGTAGQIPRKASATDYDLEWADANDHEHVPVEMPPTTMTVTYGTLDSGTVSTVQSKDGNAVAISEATGADALLVVFDFAGITVFNNVLLYGRYQGGAGHTIAVELYNPDTTNWDQIGLIGSNTVDAWLSFPVYDGATYIDTGAVSLRLRHMQTGVNTHDVYLDLVELRYATVASGGVTTHGALLGRSVADSHPISAVTDLQTTLDAKLPHTSGTITNYAETVYTITPAATIALDPANGNVQTLAMDQNTTLRCPAAPTAGTTKSFLLTIKPTGAYSLTDLTDSSSGDTGWAFWDGSAFVTTTPAIAGSGKITELFFDYKPSLSKWIVRYGIKES